MGITIAKTEYMLEITNRTEIHNKIKWEKESKPKPALDSVLKIDSAPHQLGAGGCSTSVSQDTTVGPATAIHRLSSFAE